MSSGLSRNRASSTFGEAPSGMRTDARRNRERILEVARSAFAAKGIDVPMTTIARLSGVGVATLYRHFPTRDDLIAEVFATELFECGSLLDDALADPDAWHGFCVFIERVCAMQAANPGFTEAFLSRPPETIAMADRLEGAQDLTELVRRAKRTGRLRADFDESDVLVLILANNALTQLPLPPASSRRLVAYMLQSFAAVDAPGLPATPPIDLAHLLTASRAGSQ